MCVSSRRRPMTSPPGGGTVTRPKRARSGPARRNDARISRARSASRWSSSRHSRRPGPRCTDPLDVGTELGEKLDHRLDVADPWTFESRTSPEVSTQAARIGSAPFLLPEARTEPLAAARPR